jgi:hypothetical protein
MLYPRVAIVATLIFVSFLNPRPAPAQSVPGTQPWDDPGEPSSAMVEGIHRYLDRALKESVERRQAQGHMIDGRATFAFLARHLDWPRGERPTP